MKLPNYTELHCVSNFSFLRGASHPEELIRRAIELGYKGLALTDECSVAGVVRAHQARQDMELECTAADDFKLIIGSEFLVHDSTPFRLVVLARNREGYGHLCEFITRLRRAVEGKGQAPLTRQGVKPEALPHCLFLLLPDRSAIRARAAQWGPERADLIWSTALQQARWLQALFPQQCWLGVTLLNELDDAWWLEGLQQIGEQSGMPLVAVGDVHMHVRSRKPLQDVLTAIQSGHPVAETGLALQAHAERHLRSRLRLAQRYPAELLEATQVIAQQCQFSLSELRYEYPEEVVPEGQSPASYLAQQAWAGSQRRYPNGVPDKVQTQIASELELISDLKYEKYFLTVYDIVRFARSQGILCQGRGSAANSAVCYCLGITEVDPAQSTLLFERFISKERNEPPDIDVDFEHERREEVIQYLYNKYGRDRTALTATVISYRTRSALRDVGKALGLAPDVIEGVARHHQWWDGQGIRTSRLEELGLNPQDRVIQQWQELSRALMGFPRHLSQHTGGFVMAKGPLCRMVPIENATMPQRSVIQWDKDDLDALGLLKVDVLALGMLSALKRSLAFISQLQQRRFRMQDIPREDADTYDMICAADTVGVFQIESRAQMSMLPRLQPRQFYDLVVQVAIVRPGPIQGGMVHPYLQRREEQRQHPQRDVSGTYPALAAALQRTLGIPIFQEQAMQIAVIAAGFSPGEADALRRSMAAWRRKGGVEKFEERLKLGMKARGYPTSFADQVFEQMKGFGSYGFPESHAASFAILVYLSAWIKRHYPAVFLASLINSQPLGFYSPSQLVQDAKRHGVEVRPPDVSHSEYDCTLEPADVPQHSPRHAHQDKAWAVRLGLRLVSGLSRSAIERLVQARQQRPFSHTEDLALRAQLEQSDVRALAAGDALLSLAGHRRQQVWDSSALHRAPQLLREAPVNEDRLQLPPAPEGEEIVFDYTSLGLTLRRHPLALLRPQLAAERLVTAQELATYPHGRLARACGIVTVRQQPETAGGVVFVTLEDETGTVNVIIWKHLRERQRSVLLQSRLLAVYGVWQHQNQVRHLIAHYLKDCTPLLGRLATTSRDFH
ncbi:error-prone DNA polymerase [Aquabacterium sp.]|uniref:error-prone DNA polymerase n=1 Tax=Aquabacterium sp. TaxID=1872578 RepID=UPI002E2F3A0F|nr:error-prone DNA polymerase [Aquabacterium sp.]HEX5312537.1 error-prone DNA polymerase [Aquabacterium sp.]